MSHGRAFKDISGQTIGKLTAIRLVGRQGNNTLWEFQCECGNRIAMASRYIKDGSVGCGCGRGKWNKEHGMTKTPTHRSWCGMRSRCYDKNNKDYPRYGGRGITVQDSWRESFTAFLADMGIRPEGKSLDRIDNNGPYSKENCRWATPLEQVLNRGTTVKLSVDGVVDSIAGWERKLKLKSGILQKRLSSGMPVNTALTGKRLSRWGGQRIKALEARL